MLLRRCVRCCDTSITRSWHGQCVNSSALKAAPSWRAGSLKGSLRCGRISLSTGKTVWSACLPDGSRVRRESHARFCERPVVKFHRPTQPFRPRRSKNRKGEVLHQFQSGCFRQSGEGDPGGDSKLESAFTQRQADRRPVADAQPEDSRLAPILWAVLPLGALPADASTGSITGPLGLSQIQKVARTLAQGDALGGADFPSRSEVVGALAAGRAAWLPGGSRMR